MSSFVHSTHPLFLLLLVISWSSLFSLKSFIYLDVFPLSLSWAVDSRRAVILSALVTTWPSEPSVDLVYRRLLVGLSVNLLIALRSSLEVRPTRHMLSQSGVQAGGNNKKGRGLTPSPYSLN